MLSNCGYVTYFRGFFEESRKGGGGGGGGFNGNFS